MILCARCPSEECKYYLFNSTVRAAYDQHYSLFIDHTSKAQREVKYKVTRLGFQQRPAACDLLKKQVIPNKNMNLPASKQLKGRYGRQPSCPLTYP